MPLKPLLNGYSGSIKINLKRTLCTSFGLSMQENYINSNGIINSMYDDGKFTRLSNMVIRDYPIYQIDITADATDGLLGEIFRVFDNSREEYKVEYIDDSNGITYSFTKCHLQSFSLSVSEGSLLQLSAKFIHFNDEIKFNYTNSIQDKGRESTTTSSELGGDNKLIPYWATSFSGFQGLQEDNVVEFSISWNQEITPMYGCNCGSDTKPLQPKILKFGLPAVNFGATYICGNETIFSNNGHKQPKIKDFTAKFGRREVELQQCVILSFSPILGNHSSYVGYQISCNIFGKIYEKGNGQAIQGN